MMLVAAGCGRGGVQAPSGPPAPPPITFQDVTVQAGISFVQTNGATGKKYLPETMGSGCAFLDYDNDGYQDILLVNGDYWPNTQHSNTPSPKVGGRGATPEHPTLHLYRNDHHGRFVDVTAQTGLNVEMYGMGVAVGDYDNDGYDDLYITGVGGSRLFHNERASAGAGERATPESPTRPLAHSPARYFRDVTTKAGVRSPGWATSATWLDYNRDGRLDLFVCHYVEWSPATNRFFSLDGVHPSYATPEQYPGTRCSLYRNDGGGRFTDVSASAGILNRHSKALGVIAFDYDEDGWPDILVTNDTEPNFLFHNQGDGTFKEVALETGIAVSEQGRAKAGMGVDVADEQNRGHPSIIITNFSGEQPTLYRPDESGHYLDEAARSGIGAASQYYLGFGVLFLDYDGDGWQDLFIANGHIQGDVELRQTGVVYREPALLLRNTGHGAFQDVTASAGAALRVPRIDRGAAWGDFDNDGHPDILLSTNRGDPTAGSQPQDGRPALLHNENRTGNHWLRLRLEGRQSSRDAYGARVRVRVGAQAFTQFVKGSCSYLSQSDRRLLFGLGGATKVDSIEIQWPTGEVQTVGPQPVDRSVHIQEGAAAPVTEAFR